MRMRIAALALAVTGVLAVWVLCLIPAPPPSGVHYMDKIEHASAYLLQTLAFVILFPHQRRHVVIWFVLQGLLIEGAQSLTPWRSAELADAFANGVGVAAGLLLAGSPLAQRLSQRLQPAPAVSPAG